VRVIAAVPSWPEAAIAIAIILGAAAVLTALFRSGKSDPQAWEELRDGMQVQRDILSELSAVRAELSMLRGEVAELDRVLKSVD
jgi:hypothetical protein